MKVLAVFLTTLLLAVSAFGQTNLAPSNTTLTGTLTDPAGAAIGGAEIIATPLDGAARQPVRTVTGADGAYAFTLAAGRYRVRTSHASFARAEQEFTLAAGESKMWSPRLVLERLAATVVVTAQAEPVFADAVAAPVTVLTREEIDRRQSRFLAPLLAETPGLAMTRLGREGSLTTIFLNGGNSNFTKVLVDGAPLNEPGGRLFLGNFALDNVEKIEIVRGAESALHGSDAMAGVVQILSHRGSTLRPLLDLSAEGGKFSTARGSARLSGLLGRFDYSAAAGRFHTGGQGANDFFRNTTLAGNFGWSFSETHALRLAVRSNTSDSGVPGQTLLIPVDRDHHNAMRDFTSSLAWEFTTGPRWRHRLMATETYIRQLFHDPSSDFCEFTPPFPCDFAFTARNQFNRATGQAQSSYVAPRGGFTLGYQYEVENGFFTGTHARRNNQGGYLEGRYRLAERLHITAGARAEANDSFGTRVVPRIGVAYALRQAGDYSQQLFGATRLRFSYGQGIKEPTLDQSFSADNCFPGNGGLRPERSRSFTGGVDQWLGGDRVRVSVDGFHNRFRDMVSFAFGQSAGAPPDPSVCPFGFGTFFNTDLARAYGTHLQVEARPVRWLRVSGHYSYVESKVLESPNAFDPALVPGNRLLRRPVHSGAVVVNAAWRAWNVNVVNTFSGERTDSDFLGFGLMRNPGFARVDLAMNYDVSRNVAAFGYVGNLFGERYEESIGFPAYGRHYRLGMKFTLGGE
ncbi:MAG TPA: TonB-dependent receptor [Candidatus Acidoferrales bacterium]